MGKRSRPTHCHGDDTPVDVTANARLAAQCVAKSTCRAYDPKWSTVADWLSAKHLQARDLRWCVGSFVEDLFHDTLEEEGEVPYDSQLKKYRLAIEKELRKDPDLATTEFWRSEHWTAVWNGAKYKGKPSIPESRRYNEGDTQPAATTGNAETEIRPEAARGSFRIHFWSSPP